MDKITDRTNIPTIPPVLDSSTPLSGRAIRRVQRQYRKMPTHPLTDLLFKTSIKLAAQHEIDRFTISGLERAIEVEKSKRKRGKVLNLVGEEESGPQFFSPTKIQRALDYEAQKQAQIE